MISGLLQGKTYTSSTIMSGRNEIRQGQEMVAGTWSITYLCVLRAAKRKSKGHHQAESFHSPHVSGSLVFVPPRVLLPRTGYPRERVEPCELVPLPRLWGGGVYTLSNPSDSNGFTDCPPAPGRDGSGRELLGLPGQRDGAVSPRKNFPSCNSKCHVSSKKAKV